MKANKSDETALSAQARETPRNPTLLLRASTFVSWILQVLCYGFPILTAGVYFHCYFYQEKGNADCRWDAENVMVILGCTILLWWPLNNVLSYFAHHHVRKPTK